MKAALNIVRTFSTPFIKTVGEIIQHHQVNLGIIPPVAQPANASLLKIIHDRQETLAKENPPARKYTVADCFATRQYDLGIKTFYQLTTNQKEAWRCYGGEDHPVTIVNAAENKGTVITPSQDIQK